MASGVLGTATSGLLAFQRSLSTTGHNIANASTPGYSRQRVEVGTQTPQSSGAGFIGSGVKATTVTRMYDQFLVDRVRTSTASVNSLDIYSQYASRVADLLGDADAGLNGSLETFFNSMQTLANDPTSIPARQLVLSEGEGLVARFQYLGDQLRNTRKEVNGQLDNLVQEVNTLSQGIADINKEIVTAIGRSGGQPPNDLLDTRDQLLDQLSALVSVSRVEQDDGALNVFIGNGQSLVTGYNAATLSVQGDGFDATEMNIMYTVGGVSSDITANVSGGKLGGLLSLRDEVLDAAQNALGRVAVVLGTELNAQQALGMDLDGSLGGDLFSLGTPQVSGHTINTGTGTVTASFDNATINALTIEDYIISYDGAAWNLTDADGNAVTMAGAGTLASPFNADGLNIVVGGAPAAGDRYMIRPTRAASDDIGVAISNVRAIAAAAPVQITEATNASGLPTNAGTGGLAYSGVSSGFSALAGNITLTFNSGTNELSYTDGGAVNGTLAYNPATDSGTSFTLAGVNFTVTGTPTNGDSFVLGNNASGSGDNSNALLLAGLQAGLTVENGTTNFQGAYAQLISDVATKAHQAEIGHTIQQSMFRQAQGDRDALSGVNLDEEAANLLRFQQAYQAMAQVVTVADSMFQSLLSAVRR
jgi:flagellar hook-associated protein 1 FlgK